MSNCYNETNQVTTDDNSIISRHARYSEHASDLISSDGRVHGHSKHVAFKLVTSHRRNLRRVRGVPVLPLFGLRSTVPLIFQDKKVKNLRSPAVNRSDLRRLNYNKNNFGRGSASDPAERAHDALPDPGSDEEGILPPHSPPFRLMGKGRLVLRVNWHPSLFRPKLRPCYFHNNLNCTKYPFAC